MIEIYHQPTAHRLGEVTSLSDAAVFLRDQFAPDDAADLVVIERDGTAGVVRTYSGTEVQDLGWPGFAPTPFVSAGASFMTVVRLYGAEATISLSGGRSLPISTSSSSTGEASKAVPELLRSAS